MYGNLLLRGLSLCVFAQCVLGALPPLPSLTQSNLNVRGTLTLNDEPVSSWEDMLLTVEQVQGSNTVVMSTGPVRVVQYDEDSGLRVTNVSSWVTRVYVEPDWDALSADYARFGVMRANSITTEVIHMHSPLPDGEISFLRTNPDQYGTLYLDSVAMLTASNYAAYITGLTGYLTLTNADARYLKLTDAGLTYATIAELNALAESVSYGLQFQGSWDASVSNTPDVASNGWYWLVSVAGTLTNVSPSLECVEGDSLVYGTNWSVISRGGVLTETDPFFTNRLGLALSDPDKVLTRADADSLYAPSNALAFETDPVWVYEKTNYLNIADETANANGTHITNVQAITLSGGAEISSTATLYDDYLLITSNGNLVTPGSVIAALVEADVGNFANWSAYTNYMVNPTNGLVTVLQENQAITQTNFINVNHNSTVWSNAIAMLGQVMEESIPGLSNVNVSIDYALMGTNYTVLPTNLGITASSGVAAWMTNVSMLVVTDFYDTVIFTDITNLNQNFSTINANFGAISNDFVSISNTLMNSSNGLVTLLNSNQNITVSNFGKVNYNFQQFSNAIYNVATSLAAGIVGFGTPTVNIEYAQMDTTNYTDYPTGIDISFPSTMSQAMTNIADNRIVANYETINNYVTTNIYIISTNTLASKFGYVNGTFEHDCGCASYLQSNPSGYATVPTSGEYNTPGMMAVFTDIDLGNNYASGLYAVQGRVQWRRDAVSNAFPAIVFAFGSTGGQEYHQLWGPNTDSDRTYLRASFCFLCVPLTQYLRCAGFVNTNALPNIHIDYQINWQRITLGN